MSTAGWKNVPRVDGAGAMGLDKRWELWYDMEQVLERRRHRWTEH